MTLILLNSHCGEHAPGFRALCLGLPLRLNEVLLFGGVHFSENLLAVFEHSFGSGGGLGVAGTANFGHGELEQGWCNGSSVFGAR